MRRQCLYVLKKAYFRAKMAVFGPNILISMGGSKISGKHISENDLGTSFAFFFGRATDRAPNGSEGLIFNPK